MKYFNKLILFLFIGLGFHVTLKAQVASYAFAQSSGTYTPITGGTVIVSGTVSLDSYVSGSLTIPSFTYNGIAYTTAFVTSNGFLNLGGSAPSAFTTTAVSTTTGSGQSLALFSADLDRVNTNASTEIRFETVGFETIFQWTQFKRFGVTESFDFQARLNNSTGLITFVYKLNSGPGTSTSYQPQVGIRTSTTDYNNRLVNTTAGVNWNTSLAGINSSSAARFTGSVTDPRSFVTGQTYTWTPPTPCTGTPEAGTISGALIRPTCGGSAPSPATATATGFSTGVSSLVFQWETSLDNMMWSNAVGASATTATYTLPNHTAGQIEYYRLKVTCTPSGLFDYSDVVLQVTDPAIPTTQASSVTTSALGPNTATITWTAGSGTRRFVVLSNTNSFTDPVGTGDVTVAGTVYAGSGQQIVYDGAATSVSVTGLTSNTTYYARVYEYLRCTGSPNTNYYNVSLTTNNPGSFTTLTPPANDLCSGALPIACGASLTGSNANAGDDVTPTPTCGLTGTSGSFKGVWFTVTSPLAGPLTVSACGTNYDTYMRVYGGPCGAFTTCMGSNDDFTGCSTASQVTFTAVAGTTYYILLGGYFNTSIGNYTITASCPAACVVPTSSAATNITSTTAQANWTPTTGNFIIEYGPSSTFGTPGTGATAGNVNNTVVTASNVGLKVISGLSSGVGYSYVVRQDCTAASNGYSSNSSVITFTTTPPPPVNDECATAIVLTATNGLPTSIVVGDVGGATASVGVPTGSCSTFSNTLDVWYTFNVPASGSALVELFAVGGTSNGDNDYSLQAFSGSCGSLVYVSCDEDGSDYPTPSDYLPSLSLSAQTPGNPIYLRVRKSTSSSQNKFSIGVSDPTVLIPIATGECLPSSVTISPASGNAFRFVPLLDASGGIVAEVYPYGQDLGVVSSSVHHNVGAVRTDGNGIKYMDVDHKISVTIQPTVAVDIALYVSASDLSLLMAADPAVTGIGDIKTTKTDNACGSNPSTGGTLLSNYASFTRTDGVAAVAFSPASFSNFYLHGGLTPLPVNILSFDAKALNNKTVQLTWNVAAEVDVKEYIVERSNDNRNWSAIGTVKASQKSTYGFNDNSPVSGVNYYRLAVKDVNASVAYSDIRTVNFSGKGNMALYPNPANNTLYVSGTDDKNVVVSIYNEVGQIVNTLSSNGETIRTGGIDVSQLLPGAYSIQVKGESGLTTMRFVKQ